MRPRAGHRGIGIRARLRREGPVPEIEGFWCAAGFSGHGFMQAPAAALLLSQLLLDQRSDIDITPFAFTRFARGSLVHEKNVI